MDDNIMTRRTDAKHEWATEKSNFMHIHSFGLFMSVSLYWIRSFF